MKRKALGLVGFATGLFAGQRPLPALARRGAASALDVYFDDGSMVSFVDGSPEAERLLPLAPRRARRPRAG